MSWHRIDYNAIWASDKIASCAEWAQAEYVWLYGLIDAHGCLELTNLRVIHGRVSAIRKNLPLERLEQIFDEFHAKGLLFVWKHGGKKYGYLTGCEERLPPESHRKRYARTTAPLPREQLAQYLRLFSTDDGIQAPEIITPANAGSRTPPGHIQTHPSNVTERNGTEHNEDTPPAQKSRLAGATKHSTELFQDFLQFYSAYPKKVGRKAALGQWMKIDPQQHSVIMAAVERFKATDDWQREGGRYVPNPATFLNGERWNDELRAPKRARKENASGHDFSGTDEAAAKFRKRFDGVPPKMGPRPLN